MGCTSRGGEEAVELLLPSRRHLTMASRTTTTTVSFSSPFMLPGFDAPQAPGNYRVDTDEESIEGISWLAWRRVGAFIHLPGIGARATTHEMAPINSADLDAALMKDSQPPQ
jgi:hypothetical protein